jgi:hypothetical protein
VKSFVALAALVIAAGCNRTGDADRRSEHTRVTPPVGVSVAPDGNLPARTDTARRDSARGGTKSCGVAGKPVLTEQGIGELKQGRRVSEVRELCDVISDARERGVEGMMERVLVTRIAGEPVRSIVTDDRIWRIEVTSPRFKTADSLGVDTPLERIARRSGSQFFPGEGGVYGFVPDHCGLSFRFSIPLRPPKGGQWTSAAIEKAHGDAAVDRVLITRCEH